MNKLTIEIPEKIAKNLSIPPKERLGRVRIELAIRLYQTGILGFGPARQLAEMSYWDFHNLLYQEGIDGNYDLEELEADLKTLETFKNQERRKSNESSN